MDVNIEEVEYMTETRISASGKRSHTTIPKYIADKFGMQRGDRVIWILFKNGSITVAKVSAGQKSQNTEQKTEQKLHGGPEWK